MKKLITDATRYVAMIVCARAGLCARAHVLVSLCAISPKHHARMHVNCLRVCVQTSCARAYACSCVATAAQRSGTRCGARKPAQPGAGDAHCDANAVRAHCHVQRQYVQRSCPDTS